MLDRLPTWARDLILMLVASLATWAGSDLVPLLEGKGGAAAALASVIVLLINAISPMTRAYTLRGERPPVPR